MNSSDDEGVVEDQVRVVFVTHVDEYRVTSSEIAVPASLTRSGLSQVINHLLQLKENVPFDFLVKEKDVLVRKKLGVQLEELAVSRETAVTLEYAPALEQPQLSAENQWPDWIAAVDASHSSLLVSGTYDGKVQLSELDGKQKKKRVKHVYTCDAHTAAVKCVRVFGKSGNLIATASKDGLVKLLQVEGTATTESASCEGHVGSVEAVDAVQLGEYAVIVSGSWDKTLRLWKCNLDDSAVENDAEEPQMRKSRKTGAGKKMVGRVITNSNTFEEHSDQVSSVCWADRNAPGNVFSGSWDHSIRMWDVSRECCTLQLNGSKVVTSLSVAGSTLASGHADNTVRLWDSRLTGDPVSRFSLKSHGWVASVAFCPTNAFYLASASHDKTVKIWDTRTSVPLHTITDHTNKVLAVDWSSRETGQGFLVSGGADSTLRVHSW